MSVTFYIQKVYFPTRPELITLPYSAWLPLTKDILNLIFISSFVFSIYYLSPGCNSLHNIKWLENL